MARSKRTGIELTAYDDLFETDESRAEANLSKIREIPIAEIDEFPDHPFKVLMNEDMEQLVESVSRSGVMTPATVRQKEDGRYELISGHRRKKACELAGLETLKCEVKELTRDEAIIVMVESNLQRSTIIPVVWLALLAAPYVSGGIVEIIANLSLAIENPFQITVCKDTPRVVLIFLSVYGMGIGVYFSTRRNYRKGEEHGSAKWGNAGTLNKKYRDKDASENKLLTQNVRIGLDRKKHRRNLNILVVGGSGAGKTRFFCKPNVMQCNTSMVILDPKGEIVRDTGGLLEQKGYEVRVLDLINMLKV